MVLKKCPGANAIQEKLRKYGFDHHETAQENIYGYCRASMQYDFHVHHVIWSKFKAHFPEAISYRFCFYHKTEIVKGQSGASLTSKDGVVHDHVMLPVLFEASNSKNGSKTNSQAGSRKGSKSASNFSANALKKWEQQASKSGSVASSRRSRLSKASKTPSVLSHSKVIQEVISECGSQVGNSVHPKDSASQMVVSSAGGSATSSIAMAVEELVKREVKQHIDQYLRTMAKKRLEPIKE